MGLAFGYHLIEVTSKATIEAKIADFALSLQASVRTLNRVQEELDDLLYFTEEQGDFEGEAGRRSLALNTVQIEEEQLFIFRATDHYKRLLQSGQLLLMEFDLGPEDLTKITIVVPSSKVRSTCARFLKHCCFQFNHF